MKRILAALAAVLVGVGAATAAEQERPYKVPAKIADAVQTLPMGDVKLEGMLGQRAQANERGRLLQVNEDVLLAGFRKRPGEQDWIGEHVGKFLHAATLAWANTGDPQLKEKIDRVVVELLKCQGPDGYLGTYTDDRRWTSWDVWVHKYDLIGLLTYHQYTGSQPALDAARKIGDLLIATFPSKKSIVKAGEHVGMAATSVLEPMVMLYRITGEAKYLDFAKYIVASYDEPAGPRVVKTLLDVKRVDKTANGKAYEMLSNLVGLCELYRITGDQDYLTAAKNAWQDIVANHLYITGSLSHGEHFHEPHVLPNGEKSNIAETCATVTWLQLNAQLLRLTGEAKYGDELERTIYNHLAGAQRPDGAQWAYYTPLVGRKPYGPGTNCCVSSGPRGIAMSPALVWLKYKADGAEGLAVNLLEPGEVKATVGGQKVAVKTEVDAEDGAAGATVVKFAYAFDMAQAAKFTFKVRSPAWAGNMKVSVEGAGVEAGGKNGWAELPAREWKNGDRAVVSFEAKGRKITGEYTNKGYSALAWGPFVLAMDENYNKGLGPVGAVALLEGAENLKVDFNEPWMFTAKVRTAADAAAKDGVFVTYADAGAEGTRMQVWMRNPDNLSTAAMSLLAGGKESRSRRGNQGGSACDGENESFVVTFDGKTAAEDWYAVEVDAPVQVKRIVYAHGRCFHDGGWFDGKPTVQVKKEKNGPWETVGTIEGYPATTATNNGGLKDGQAFEVKLKEPTKIVGVRVIGKPASGDNAKQAFSSCGEIGAFAD